MTLLYTFINNFLQKNNINNIPPYNDIISNKWIPDNDLVIKYNKYLIVDTEIKRLKNNLDDILIPNSKQLLKEYIKKNRSKDINDKNDILNIKNKMLIIEKQIANTENLIKELDYKDDTIKNLWNDYLKKAQNFLIINNINKNITLEDILTDGSLFLLCNKNLHNYIMNTNYLNIINDIILFFDFNSQINLENINSFEILKNTPEIFFHNSFESIFYNLNNNNEPFEILDDNICLLFYTLES
jgi:hypothetical protein